jgi:hypothetical protein
VSASADALKPFERMIKLAYKALTNVKHNGHWYSPGDTLKKINKEDAERLADLGAVKEDKKEDKEE